MIIIRKKANNIITHAGNDLQLQDNGLWANNSWNPTLNTSTCDQLEVELPAGFQGNAWTYTETDGWNLVKPEVLNQAKADKCVKIATERDRRVAQGMSYTFPDGKTGTAQLRDNTDIRNIQGLATRGFRLESLGDTTTTIPFRDAEDVTHQMIGSEMVTFSEVIGDYIQAHYDNSWLHKDAVRGLITMEDVQNYDYSVGWP